jgi:hypothetical protein
MQLKAAVTMESVGGESNREKMRLANHVTYQTPKVEGTVMERGEGE